MFNTFIPGSIARAAAFVVCCVIVPASCASRARTGGDFQPDRATEMSFTGRVVDEEDKSVPSAVVGINSVQGSTDDKGAFVVTPAKA